MHVTQIRAHCTLECVFEIGLEKRQVELRRVAAGHDVDAVRHDGQRHEEGVDCDGEAAVAHVVVPEARGPAATQILSSVHHDVLISSQC